ncbi:MAG: hypothetical protein Q4D19_13110, partial [Lautropia sp.]|nr:hypothetical protein [Lautropia sp.]
CEALRFGPDCETRMALDILESLPCDQRRLRRWLVHALSVGVTMPVTALSSVGRNRPLPACRMAGEGESPYSAPTSFSFLLRLAVWRAIGLPQQESARRHDVRNRFRQ